jgi:UDP-N-acetylglucosamine 2-epimerase (non-hydrolysing)
MKILSLIGARPQFVKEAIIQNEISKHSDIEEVVVHTGQHYDENMSGVFFKVLNMKKPDYNLGINSKSHSQMTAMMMIEIEKIIVKESPDVVLLYGDTNSTLAGALVCSKLKVKVAHIEAGLRQKPKDMPEEINRVLTDHVSDYLFTPSKIANYNLANEGLTENVYFVGDVMYDVYKIMENKFDDSILKKLELEKNNFIILTLHRDFNVDDKEILEKILYEINRISKEKTVVFPIHPRTKKRIIEFGLEEIVKNVKIIEPLDYLELMSLTQHAYKIITDSGGYQKEAYFALKEALVFMPDTAWRELLIDGGNKLVDYTNIYNEVFKNNKIEIKKNIYGDGDAAQKIISVIKNNLDVR